MNNSQKHSKTVKKTAKNIKRILTAFVAISGGNPYYPFGGHYTAPRKSPKIIKNTFRFGGSGAENISSSWIPMKKS